MSVVTNVILTTAVGEAQGMELLNEWISRTQRGQKLHLASRDLPGSHKAMEQDVHLGAFNYFPHMEFIDQLMAIEWKWPESIVLMLKLQDDDRFEVVIDGEL